MIICPSTLVGYKSVKKNRFKSVMQCPVADIKDWQGVINAEAAICSPKAVIEHFAEVKLTVSELQRTVGGSSSFKHTQIMTALTPMNAIIAASGGQDTNVISSQKKPHDRFSLSCGFSYSISGAGHIASALYTKTTLEVCFEVRWVKIL